MPVTIDQLVECVNRDYRAASEALSFFPQFIDPLSPDTLPVNFPDGLREVPTLQGLTAAIDTATMTETVDGVRTRVDQLDTLSQGILSALNRLGAQDGPTWRSYDLTSTDTTSDMTDPMFRANVENGVRFPFDAYVVVNMDRRNPGDWTKIGAVLLPPHTDAVVKSYSGAIGTDATAAINVSQYPAFTKTVTNYNYNYYTRYYGYYYYYWRKYYWNRFYPYAGYYGYYYSYYSVSTYTSTVTSPLSGSQTSQTFQVETPTILKGIRLWSATAGSGLASPPKLLITESTLGMPDLSKIIGQATVVNDSAYTSGQGGTTTSLTETAFVSFAMVAPIYLQPGKSYAFTVVVPDGASYSIYTTANKFTKGGVFYTQDGAMWTQDLAKDLLFSLVKAQFVAGEHIVELNPLSVSGGIASIKSELSAIVADDTTAMLEVDINSVWRDVEVMDTIDQLPPFTPVRLKVTATVDAAPLVDTVTSRITAFRPAMELRFTGVARPLPSATTLKVSVAVMGYDTAFHTISFSAKFGTKTLSPDMVRPVYGSNASAQFEVVFTPPVDSTDYQLSITGNTTLATRVFDVTSIVEL